MQVGGRGVSGGRVGESKRSGAAGERDRDGRARSEAAASRGKHDGERLGGGTLQVHAHLGIATLDDLSRTGDPADDREAHHSGRIVIGQKNQSDGELQRREGCGGGSGIDERACRVERFDGEGQRRTERQPGDGTAPGGT